MRWVTYGKNTMFHPKFFDWMSANGYDVESAKTMSDAELSGNTWEISILKPLNDIDWVAKVKMQGAIQKWLIIVSVLLLICLKK